MYFKTSSDRINFTVKTKKAAHICLSNVANINQPFIEFVIEINISDRSELRMRNGNSNLVVKKSIVRKNLLSESEYRGFWIYFNEGVSRKYIFERIALKTKFFLELLIGL